MNEELFNMDLRKFLKRFGVSAQREIEKAIHKGIEAGVLTGTETVKVRAWVEVEGLDGDLLVEDELHLA
jgi:uncharacterized protein DUF6494